MPGPVAPVCKRLSAFNSKYARCKDRELLKSREVLLFKKKRLVLEEAKGNHPHAAKELSNAEEDFLFGSGELSAENPEPLSAQLGGYWHHTLDSVPEWEDIVLQTENETGKEFLNQKEGQRPTAAMVKHE